MVDSVSGSQRPQQTPPALLQEDIKKAAGLSQGFDPNNSVSHQTGELSVLSLSNAATIPTIPQPGQGTTQLTQIQELVTQGEISQIRSNLHEGITALRSNNPTLATDEVRNQLQMVDHKLSSLSTASPETQKSIQNQVNQFKNDASNGVLTTDKLEEILAQISASLEDNSAKYSQNKIELAAQDKIQAADSNINKIREHIENTEQAQEQQNQNQGIFALKIIASVLFPPLGIFEGVQAAGREITGRDNGLSIFSSQGANKQHWEKLGQELGQETGVLPPKKTSEGSPPYDPVGEATEGLTLAEGGLSQAEMMKLLKQQQEAEENKEKLEKAVEALESGDPKLAAEVLGGNVDGLGLEGALGDSLGASPKNAKQPTEAPPADDPGSDGEFSSSASDGTGNTPPPQTENIGTPPSSTGSKPFSQFLDELTQVPVSALNNQQAATSEQGLIQRHNAV